MSHSDITIKSKLDILVIGGGGREHAILRALRASARAGKLYAAPGNGGIAADTALGVTCAPIGAKDIAALVAYAKDCAVDYVVVAPDDPLALGAVDALAEAGIPAFGPTKAAARIESSKVFSKGLMEKYGIPTASCRVFENAPEALAYVHTAPAPLVVKADGLALGKGVVIAQTNDEAENAVRSMMEQRVFGDSGSRIVVEEFLTGPEVSVLAFTDGETVVPMVSSMDHKRALDGDRGLNTGGMGTVAPNPFYTESIADTCMKTIFLPTVRAMKAEGCPFSGCLYFGLMLTPDGPKVIEYNCRFGDPETQVVLPLMESDLLEAMIACTLGTLSKTDVRFSEKSACCVIAASGGYPTEYKKGMEINIAPAFAKKDAYIYYAGAERKGEKLVTSGGRVLGVTAVRDTARQAVDAAYAAVGDVSFEGMFCRRDIGRRALSAAVRRIYVEKKPGLENEASALESGIRSFLRIPGLQKIRLLNRYDVQGVDDALFAEAKDIVFSEPQLDNTYVALPDTSDARTVFAVEYLPGQFDQRADSASQCIQLLSQGERPTIRTAKVYILYGTLSDDEIDTIRKYIINPVESREASLDTVKTLDIAHPTPEAVKRIDGFCSFDDARLGEMLREYGFAMDLDDLRFCRDYFTAEKRDPTVTELRVIDTYWSDHCRHTTFLTTIDGVTFADPVQKAAYEDFLACRERLGRGEKPVCLMELATLATRDLKSRGLLPRIDESEEINACTVKIKVNVDGQDEDWLLLFKNETHNHPTEIEPFGGAATCIGGAIRDPLSGRSYVYAAMRVTGAADPLRSVDETIPGKLPQRKIVTTAAAGYSSYGNQIGLATGQVSEIYHDGYAAKHMEIGAVLGATPASHVRREVPADGDIVLLIGGRTGRDGCGGATGSSKSHDSASLITCGAEVQKGNAPEERKLQRLMRRSDAARLIKRCNDFGAGGVSVAVGELADGLEICLDAVPKKYAGLDGTELAISESQERMAVVVAPQDAERFIALATEENIEATQIAVVTAEPRMRMSWRGDVVADLSREFLASNGAEKHTVIAPDAPLPFDGENRFGDGKFVSRIKTLAADLNVCSQQGLSERFDSTIGAGTVLMPFGGRHQRTPIQAMVHKIPLEHGHTDDCSVMAWGFNPDIADASPFHSAYLAVVESVSKLIAAGADFNDVYLTFQEYFEKPNSDPRRWGKPLSALLGAFRAQRELGIASIGGKDSMSGSFTAPGHSIDVPPTLVSFAVTMAKTGDIVSPEFKDTYHNVVLFRPEYGDDGLPKAESLIDVFRRVTALVRSGEALSVATPSYGGIAEAVMKMSFGNGIGFDFEFNTDGLLFGYNYGSFIVELAESVQVQPEGTMVLGRTNDRREITLGDEWIKIDELYGVYSSKLEPVYPVKTAARASSAPDLTIKRFGRTHWVGACASKPRVLIPVFPGTNCCVDTARAFEDAGGVPEIFVVRNLTPEAVAESAAEFAAKMAQAQIVFIPGGFSGGDEPDGSAKFITSFFRNPRISDAVTEFLDVRRYLMGGICNGFQALIKLGLLPYGRITDPNPAAPTLTFNTIGRHQSRLVRARIVSNFSPWLYDTRIGDTHLIPISHGEGRFICSDRIMKTLISSGQIATQYVDENGKPSLDIEACPNGSVYAVEGITSPDGRVFGRMGHAERTGSGLYRNVERGGKNGLDMFRSAVMYFG